MKVDFTPSGSSRDALFPGAQSGRLVNFYREPLMPGGKGGFLLRSVPGMAAFATLGRVFMRDMVAFNDDLMTLCGGVLARITPAGAVTEIASLGDSEASGLAVNTGYVTIAANGGYRVFNGTTLSAPPTGAITAIGSVAYLGGYTILTERGGRRLQWSALADPTTFSGLDFASAETTDQPITRAVTWQDVLVIFKQNSLEQWARTGLAGPDAFQRIGGADAEVGLRAYGLVTQFPNGLAFCGNDGRVYLFAGQMQPVSTPPVEVALSENVPERMFYYEWRGHGFLCIGFRDCPAWCYDIATGEWHERDEAGGPWTARATVKRGAAWHVGDNTGRVSVISGLCRDFGQQIVRRAVSMPVAQRANFRVSRLELFPRVGQDRQTADATVLDDAVSLLSFDSYVLGDAGADGGRARIGLRVSRDGVRFGDEKIRDLGEAGQYDRKVAWRNLGLFRGVAAFEVRLSADADIPLVSAAEVDVA